MFLHLYSYWSHTRVYLKISTFYMHHCGNFIKIFWKSWSERYCRKKGIGSVRNTVKYVVKPEKNQFTTGTFTLLALYKWLTLSLVLAHYYLVNIDEYRYKLGMRTLWYDFRPTHILTQYSDLRDSNI